MNEMTVALNNYDQLSCAQKDALLRELYSELKTRARYISGKANSSEVNPTMLVNEAFIKLFGKSEAWANHKHFFVVASKAMRQIVVDTIRTQNADKRGGAMAAVTFTDDLYMEDKQQDTILKVDQILSTLSENNDSFVQLVELKFFVGLTNEEVSEIFGVSRRTVQRQWNEAKRIIESEL